jgi:hypothetical protein
VLTSRAFRRKPHQEPADGISGAAGPARPPLAGEALALAAVIAGATALSRSCLIIGEDQHPACPDQPAVSRAADPHDRAPVTAGRQ